MSVSTMPESYSTYRCSSERAKRGIRTYARFGRKTESFVLAASSDQSYPDVMGAHRGVFDPALRTMVVCVPVLEQEGMERKFRSACESLQKDLPEGIIGCVPYYNAHALQFWASQTISEVQVCAAFDDAACRFVLDMVHGSDYDFCANPIIFGPSLVDIIGWDDDINDVFRMMDITLVMHGYLLPRSAGHVLQSQEYAHRAKIEMIKENEAQAHYLLSLARVMETNEAVTIRQMEIIGGLNRSAHFDIASIDRENKNRMSLIRRASVVRERAQKAKEEKESERVARELQDEEIRAAAMAADAVVTTESKTVSNAPRNRDVRRDQGFHERYVRDVDEIFKRVIMSRRLS